MEKIYQQTAKIRCEKIAKLTEEFQALRDKYSEHGAGDSEPRYKFQNALRNAAEGIRHYPSTVDGWELFEGAGAKAAAAALTRKTKRIVDLILDTPLSDSAYIQDYVRRYVGD